MSKKLSSEQVEFFHENGYLVVINGDYSGQIFNAERWTKYVNAPVCA